MESKQVHSVITDSPTMLIQCRLGEVAKHVTVTVHSL